ncbi:MAG: hypothetical protein RR140_01975 [Clostridia bacterium]
MRLFRNIVLSLLIIALIGTTYYFVFYNKDISVAISAENGIVTIEDRQVQNETQLYKKNQTITFIAKPNTGYDFNFWQKNGVKVDGQTGENHSLTVIVKDNSTYTAIFTAKTFKITVENEGGNVVKNISYNSKITEEILPTLENKLGDAVTRDKRFMGCYAEVTLGKKFKVEDIFTELNDITVKPVYLEEYSLTFKTYKTESSLLEELSPKLKVVEGQEYNFPITSQKINGNKAFTGDWQIEGELAILKTNPTFTGTRDITIIPVYAQAYIIKFASVSDEVMLTKNKTVNIPKYTPSDDTKYLSKWTVLSGGELIDILTSTTTFELTDAIANSATNFVVTVNAVENDYQGDIIVNYNGHSFGGATESKLIKKVSGIVSSVLGSRCPALNANPDNSTLTFAGFSDLPEGEVKYLPTNLLKFTKDIKTITLYAIWKL